MTSCLQNGKKSVGLTKYPKMTCFSYMSYTARLENFDNAFHDGKEIT